MLASYMLQALTSRDEGQVTIQALIRCFSTVCSQVGGQVTPESETQLTLTASIGLYSTVCSGMSVEIRACGEVGRAFLADLNGFSPV